MNGNCQTCPVESQCAYPYKPTDCCDQRKFRPMKAATTMPNSLDREAFEAKFSQPPYEFEMDRCGPDSSWPGGYREYHVQCAWEGWQAGAAAERERVNMPCTHENGYAKWDHWACRDCGAVKPDGVREGRPNNGWFPSMESFSAWKNGDRGIT